MENCLLSLKCEKALLCVAFSFSNFSVKYVGYTFDPFLMLPGVHSSQRKNHLEHQLCLSYLSTSKAKTQGASCIPVRKELWLLRSAKGTSVFPSVLTRSHFFLQTLPDIAVHFRRYCPVCFACLRHRHPASTSGCFHRCFGSSLVLFEMVYSTESDWRSWRSLISIRT